MKNFIKSLTVLSIIAYTISAFSAERFRAHYEVNVDDGTSVKTVRTSCFMTPGTPILNEMGENTLSLTVEAGQGDEYVLTVELTPAAAGSSADAPFIGQSFNGRLAGPSNGPLEFSMNKDGLKIYGAISLSSPNQ